MMLNYLVRRVNFAFLEFTEFNSPIYIDTNLVFRENMYHRDGTPIFPRLPSLCPGYSTPEMKTKKGRFTLPDSLKSKVGVIRSEIDFDIDSFTYYLASMPVYIKEKEQYVAQFYSARMQPIAKYLTVKNVYFDKKGKPLNIYGSPCKEKSPDWVNFHSTH